MDVSFGRHDVQSPDSLITFAIRPGREEADLLSLGIVAVTALVLAALVALARKRGGRAPGVPEILTEPPEEIHPAELAVLWGSFRRASPLLAALGVFDPWTQRALYQTELLHLAHEGVIEVEAVGRVTDPADLRVSLRKEPGPVDRGFVQFLFPAGAGTRTLREVAQSSDRAAFAQWAGALRSKVLASMVTTQLRGAAAQGVAGLLHGALGSFVPLYRRDRGWTARLASTVSIVAAVAIAIVAREGAAKFLLAALCVVGGIVAVRMMPYRVPEAFRPRLARWAAFRRFLVSHAEMDDAPALAVSIWERYLVYASALQAADEVEAQVRRVVPVSMLLLPWLGGGGLAGSTAWLHSLGSLAPAGAKIWRPSKLIP